MRDEFHDPSLEAASQKSVTDWLMQVISGKKPIEPRIGGAAEDTKALEPETRSVEAGGSVVAISDVPRAPAAKNDWAEHIASANGMVAKGSEFTAEDLCGPPVLPIISVIQAVKPAPEEITAEDLCWVPKGQELKPLPQAVAETSAAEEAKPQAEREVTAADISRDTPLEMPEPGTDDIEAILRRLEQAQHPVTPADISRETEHYAEPQVAEADAAEAVEQEPETGLDLTYGAAPEVPELAAETGAIAVPIESETTPEMQPEASAAQADEVAEEPDQQEAVALHEESAPESVEVQPEEAAATHDPVEQDSVPFEALGAEAVAEPMATVDASTQTELGEDASPEAEHVQPWEMSANAAAVSVPEPGQSKESQAAGAVESVFAKEDVWKHGGVWREPTSAEAAARDDIFQDQAFREQEKHFTEERMYSGPGELKGLGARPEGWNAAWKTLLRLGAVLPWLARALPMLESGASGEQGVGLVQEVRHEVAGIRLVQYEIKTAVQDHSLQLKRVEDQLARLRESMNSPDHDNLAETVQSTAQLVKWVGIGLGALLVVLLIMVAVLLMHGHL